MCCHESSEAGALRETENPVEWALRRESFLDQSQTLLQPKTLLAEHFAAEFLVLCAEPPASLVSAL